MEYCVAQVMQKDVGRRLQVGQEIIDFITDKEKSHDLEQDQAVLDRMVDGIASSWVNSSNFKVGGHPRRTYLGSCISCPKRQCVQIIIKNLYRNTGTISPHQSKLIGVLPVGAVSYWPNHPF